MKTKHLVIFSSVFIFLFILFNANFVIANNISFSPNELINITGIKCLDQNNSDCSDTIECNISILYQNNSFLIANQSMDILDSGFRSYNTGITPTGELKLFAVVNCENGGIEPFTIIVAYDEDSVDIHYWLYGSLMFFGIVFSIYGFKNDKFIYIVLPGFMFMLVGLNIIANGFPNINDQYISGGAGTILMGIGASFILYQVGKIGELDKK